MHISQAKREAQRRARTSNERIYVGYDPDHQSPDPQFRYSAYRDMDRPAHAADKFCAHPNGVIEVLGE